MYHIRICVVGDTSLSENSIFIKVYPMSQVTSVHIVTGWRLDKLGLIHDRAGILPPYPNQLWVTPNDYQNHTKKPEHKAKHSLQFSAKVKNVFNYSSSPPYIFMA
jgi:putative SOS response-associated peptidase YedK